MSRCVLDDEVRYEVSIGWDSSMETFFAQISDLEIEGEDSEKIIFWSGGVDRKFYKIPDELIAAIQPFASKHDPVLLKQELLKDKETGSERFYSMTETGILD
jgi:hypothetical protein